MLLKDLKNFIKDLRGVVAVEFALIAPFLIVLYIGCIEVSQALTTQRKLVLATAIVGDLVAQDDEIDDRELNNIIRAAQAAMAPNLADKLSIRITSLRLDDEDDGPYVHWSEGYKIAPYNSDVPTIPDSLFSEGFSVIMVETTYSYSGLYSQYISKTIKLKDVTFNRPRLTSWVARDD